VSQPRRPRSALVYTAVLVVLLGFGLVGAIVIRGGSHSDAAWRLPEISETPAASPTPHAPEAPRTIQLSATGDIVMGDAPNSLPANDGRGFFTAVRQALAADLVMGNLEEPLTEDTGFAKCPAGSSGCHQFRAPPSYAKHLRDAGFELLNLANNHAYDFGPAGNRNTRAALEKYGLKHTGAPDEITVVDVQGVKVAVVGFSSYAWSNSLIDIPAAKRVVQEAAGKADIVVVQVHMGGEGADKVHVKPGTEIFLGENRGDPIKFAHAVIDAGADLVIGHGPHVLRAVEFYRDRLIAYSLGNFAGGGGTLNNGGRLGLSAVLKVSLRADGGWAGGQLISTRMGAGGKPVVDPARASLALVRDLCEADFPRTSPRWSADGTVRPPT
jgi:poly-gamma-glutamate capsule biosynthesis protein CapA/YwtB (metallophosphatase superfamily)